MLLTENPITAIRHRGLRFDLQQFDVVLFDSIAEQYSHLSTKHRAQHQSIAQSTEHSEAVTGDGHILLWGGSSVALPYGGLMFVTLYTVYIILFFGTHSIKGRRHAYTV